MRIFVMPPSSPPMTKKNCVAIQTTFLWPSFFIWLSSARGLTYPQGYYWCEDKWNSLTLIGCLDGRYYIILDNQQFYATSQQFTAQSSSVGGRPSKILIWSLDWSLRQAPKNTQRLREPILGKCCGLANDWFVVGHWKTCLPNFNQ